MIAKKTIERFWNKVRKTDQCWNWIASVDGKGYGQFNLSRKMVSVHRISYILAKGSIPKELELDHLCRNKICVNPNHLETVTHRENLLRGKSPSALNAKKTHCIRGHEFTPENTYRKKNNRKNCKICHKEYGKKYWILHKKGAKDHLK